AKDWGRSDDDERHRIVIHATVNSSMEPAETGWQNVTHGFTLSGLVQSYSALPLNVTSGVTTVQGTAGRPIVNGSFIGRNAGVGPDFFSLNLRMSRSFTLGPRLRVEGLVEVFNVTNRTNGESMIGNFRAGTYP